jgi:hypothetical protein
LREGTIAADMRSLTSGNTAKHRAADYLRLLTLTDASFRLSEADMMNVAWVSPHHGMLA